MSRDRICTGCEHDKNGWCKARKTNKGLRELTKCEFRSDSKINKLKELRALKLMEYEIDKSLYTSGVIKGIDLALSIIEN